MAQMDSYLYSYRARHNPPVDPPAITITREQYESVKAWAEARPLQQAVKVDEQGGMTYNGIEVRSKT